MGSRKPACLPLAAMMCAAAFAVGCAERRATPTTQPARVATDIDPQTATTDYWLAQEAAASVESTQYEHLFSACNHVLRQRYFVVDRSDFRNGALTSRPLISKQIWEFWRQDVGTYSDQLKSSIATYRRTVHWTIAPTEAGRFVATPMVVVERYSAEPRRLTTVTSYRSAVNSAPAQTRLDSPALSAVTPSAWYAVGRDTVLEKELADHARSWLTGN